MPIKAKRTTKHRKTNPAVLCAGIAAMNVAASALQSSARVCRSSGCATRRWQAGGDRREDEGSNLEEGEVDISGE